MAHYAADPSCHYHLRKLSDNKFTFDVKTCYGSEYQRPDRTWTTAEEALSVAKAIIADGFSHAHGCTMRFVNRVNHPEVVAYDRSLTTFEHAPTARVQLVHKDE